MLLAFGISAPPEARPLPTEQAQPVVLPRLERAEADPRSADEAVPDRHAVTEVGDQTAAGTGTVYALQIAKPEVNIGLPVSCCTPLSDAHPRR